MKHFWKWHHNKKQRDNFQRATIDILCMLPTDIICISMAADLDKESKYVVFLEKKYLYHHEKCIHKSLLYTMDVVVHHSFLLVRCKSTFMCSCYSVYSSVRWWRKVYWVVDMCTMCTNHTYSNSTCFFVSTLCSRWLALAASTHHAWRAAFGMSYLLMIREWTGPNPFFTGSCACRVTYPEGNG